MRRLIAALTALTLLTGCTSTPSAQMSCFAMDTIITATVYGDGCEQAAQGAISLVSELSAMWSVTDAKSEISALNQNGTAELSKQTAELIGFAQEINSATGGAFDITLYPVLREWGFTTDSYRVPEDDRLEELLELTGSDKVSLSDNTATVTDGTQLDLGAVAKGYAGDLAAEYIRQQGITCALLDLGGNIHAIGSSPDGTPWKLGIRDPFGDGSIAVLALSDAAAVTSGGYERYFTDDDGKRYCHILDPATGKPADSGLASVTVIGKEGRLCDAISTAVYVMGAEKGAGLQRTMGGFELVMITNDGDILITAGIQQLLTTSEDFKGTVTVLVS